MSREGLEAEIKAPGPRREATSRAAMTRTKDGEDDNEEGCTPAALVKGAIVRRAELRLSSFGAVWEKIDLIQ